MMHERKSKYTELIRASLLRRGHATNTQIADDVRVAYPLVSDTTIHRVTQRLVTRGQCGLAPIAHCGSRRFDATPTAHDHFECSRCGDLRDITISASFRGELRQEVGDCSANGPLTIQGVCRKCLKNEKGE